MILSDRTIRLHISMRLLGRRQNWRQIELLRLPVSHSAIQFQHIHTPDHFIDRAETQFRHNLSSFLSHHEQIIHDMLGLPLELLPKRDLEWQYQLDTYSSDIFAS